MTTKWDNRFIELAERVASWSKDPSTKCGAVIVRPDRTIASTGYNGFPKRCVDHEFLYEDRDLKLSRVIHAEVNAILFAKESLEDYTMYTVQNPHIGPSCDRCSAHIVQAGISRVVTKEFRPIPERWIESIQRGLDMYDEAGVEVIAI